MNFLSFVEFSELFSVLSPSQPVRLTAPSSEGAKVENGLFRHSGGCCKLQFAAALCLQFSVYLTVSSQNVSAGIPKGKTVGIPDHENPVRFPLWPSGESGQAVCGALCAPRRQAARCHQTAAHAYAPLALPLAARSNAAIRKVPGGSLDTFSPERE